MPTVPGTKVWIKKADIEWLKRHQDSPGVSCAVLCQMLAEDEVKRQKQGKSNITTVTNFLFKQVRS